jgi:hypothetical protein
MPDCEAKCTDKCDVKCEKPKCCKPCCADIKCDEYSGFEICCKWRAATVDITGQLGVVTDTADIGSLAYYQINGNGAFISKHLILTSSALVIAPPSAFNGAVKFPLDSGATVNNDSPPDMVAMTNILVTVRNYNGRAVPAKAGRNCKKSDRFDGYTLTLKATPLIVDGAGGYAILYVDYCKSWNKCYPPLKPCHPKFCMGNSRKLHCGDPAYILGSLIGTSPGSQSGGFGISKGVVSDRRFVDPSGWALPEMVVFDNNKFAPGMGAPMINRFGQLVAIQLTSTPGIFSPPDAPFVGGPANTLGHGGVAGVAEFFMRDALNASIMVYSSKTNALCGGRRNRLLDHLESVNSNPDTFYKWIKGFAGIAYELVAPSDFNTYLENSASGVRNLLLNEAGTALFEGPSVKLIAGIRVQNLVSGNGNGLSPSGPGASPVSYVLTPGLDGGVFQPSVTNDSNFTPAIAPEDQLVVVDRKCYLGDEMGQIAPAVRTWKKLPDETLSFTFRRPSVDYTNGTVVSEDDHLNVDQIVSAKLVDFPAVYDYPWFLSGILPLVATRLVPGLPTMLPIFPFKPAF